VLIEEPSVAETKVILHNIKEKYEDHHNVSYTDEAIDECVIMADRYFPDKAQPDKSIDILDEVGATTNVDVKTPPRITELEEKKTELLKLLSKFEKLDIIFVRLIKAVSSKNYSNRILQ
jgi:ATP-dependent Clp protease ATP-binding subunit ClpC